jgi:hypothetical protein
VKNEWLVYDSIVRRLEDHSEGAVVCGKHMQQILRLFNELNVVVGVGGNPEVKAPVRTRFPPRTVHADRMRLTRALCFMLFLTAAESGATHSFEREADDGLGV